MEFRRVFGPGVWFFSNYLSIHRLSENPAISVGVLEAGLETQADPLIDTPREP